MEKFTVLQGIAAPLLVANIDTDVIIRIERMSNLARGELGPWAFEALRWTSDGTENPEFILNQEPFRAASILLAGANFGCGSSREMAVWALQEHGIRCIIAPSFGDIFFSNCLQNGVLAIRLAAAAIDGFAAHLLSDPPNARLTVDLLSQEIRYKKLRLGFDIEALARESLLEGLDAIAATLLHEADIAAFEQRNFFQNPSAPKNAAGR